jgi:phosphoglycolate phosphatase-like HAD superfamily hydrolase
LQRLVKITDRMMAAPRLLVLFDIDGTLLHTLGAGIRGMNRAFGRLHGRPDALDGVPIAGRTDRSIVTDGLRRIGVEPDRERIHTLRDIYVGELPDELSRVSGTAGVLPGVERMIDAFEDSGDLAVGLLTGNFEASAAIKLNHYGLGGRFTFGGYGDDYLDRRDLLPMAIERARAAGVDATGSRVVVIGDTPLDVDCAHAHGALAVAVATGNYSADDLARAGADVVVETLEDDRAIDRILRA